MLWQLEPRLLVVNDDTYVELLYPVISLKDSLCFTCSCSCVKLNTCAPSGTRMAGSTLTVKWSAVGRPLIYHRPNSRVQPKAEARREDDPDEDSAQHGVSPRDICSIPSLSVIENRQKANVTITFREYLKCE
jgi:hypothetical protein